MDTHLPNEEKGAAVPGTLANVSPNSADMDAIPPAENIEVDDSSRSEASSAEAVSTTLHSRENEAARGLAAVETNGEDETIKDSMLEKDGPADDKKVKEMKVAKACPQTEDGETHNVEHATSHEAMEACSHTPQYENAEITLVVEMNTDAEMTVESGVKGEEIMQGEADTSLECGASLQGVEQSGASQYKEEDEDISPAAIHEHAQTSVTENTPLETMRKVQTSDRHIGQNEPADSDMHIEVETQTLTFSKGFRDGLLSVDETKGVKNKGEQPYVHAEAQDRKDADKSCIGEDADTSRGELEAKSDGILNELSGLPEAMERVENDEAGSRKGEALAGCMEIVVEAGDTEQGCKVMDVEMEANTQPCVNEGSAGIMDVEMEANTQPCVNEVSAGIMDGEREKDGTAEQDLAGVKGSNGMAEEMVDINRKEQAPGSTTLQMELGAKNMSLENEDVQAGSLENSKGRDGVGEGIERVEGTEAMRNKEVAKVEEPGQWSNKPSVMDANTIVSDEQRMNVNIFQHMESDSGENAKQEVQEMCRETEAHTSDAVPLQHHLDVGRAPQLAVKECECHQFLERNIESGKEIGTGVIGDHIALHSNKDMVKTVDFKKVEQGGQRKEEGPGQNLQGSPAIQGPLENFKSKNPPFETSCSEGDRRVQWERQHNRQVHAEMQIRLLPDKSVKADLIKSHEVVEGGSGMRMLKELPFAKSKEAQDEESSASVGQHWRVGIVMQVKTKAGTPMEERPKDTTNLREVGFEKNQGWVFQQTGYENAAHGFSRGGRAGMFEEEKIGMSDEANTGTSEEEKYLRAAFAKGDIIDKASQKRKLSDNLALDSGTMNEHGQNDNVVKKAKKKAVNVWAKSSSRKGPKKNTKNGVPQNPSNEDSVLLTPVYVNPDKLEDGPDQPIALSKYDKAEKIELSENRLTASSTKGYRMVRATRGVQEGAWYFEIILEQLGPTGHTRLGWSTQKGDVQAPVGFDSNSYGYRDLDGSKTHVAIREPYGDLYVEGDVIGFYINLPNGAEYAPKPAPLFSYRGRPYLSDIKEEQPRKVPGSEICFFRNGVCQGTAFRDINAGRYFPAASMYTLPKEPSCVVRFNFGPEFRFPPVDIGDRPPPVPMVHAPYHNAQSGKEVGTVAWENASATGNTSLNNELQMKIT